MKSCHEKVLNIKRYITIIALLFSILMISGCSAPTGSSDSEDIDGVASATLARYQDLEIREYKGARLDPAVGPRDNSINGVQTVDISGYTLVVDGLVDDPVSLTYDQVLAMESAEKLITLHCVEGWDATILWKGVLITDIVDMAGDQAAANTVIFHCVDGYTTSMPLKIVQDRKMILAYSSNGLPLPPSMGFPFIVVAEDKLGYKWARWVNRIELSGDSEYQGFWERNGYENDAEVPASRK
ncbi:MAG: molybdopterin-dependent oxidoreductase [Saccharofermentanales bacterium]